MTSSRRHEWLVRVTHLSSVLIASCALDERSPGVMEEGTLQGAPAGGAGNDARGVGGSSVGATPDAGVVNGSGASDVVASGGSASGGADPGQGGGAPPLPGAVPAQGTGLLTSVVARMDFGQQEIGTASEDVAWTITNSGAEPLGPLSPSSSSPEFQVASGCPAVLEAGASCDMGVSFHPQGAAFRSATLTVSDGSSAALSLEVQGTGVFRLTVVRAGPGGGTLRSSLPGIDCGSQCSALFAEPVQLQARTQNGADSFFAGWSSPDAAAQCNGPARDCLVDRAQTLTATFAAQDNNLIFVSSRRYPANLGGLAPYDAECNALATAAGINDAAGSAYIAAMSDTADAANPRGNVIERLGAARGWVRMDGFPVGDDSASVFQLTPLYAPMFTEEGARSLDVAWTGLGVDVNGGDHCGGWTQARADSIATVGAAGELSWWGGSTGLCSDPWSVYCMGTSKQQPLGGIVGYQGKRVWRTTTVYTPGGMTPDQKCQSERPPGVAAGVAFITYTDRPASAVIDPAATYVLPDGRLLGSGAQLLELKLLAGPWLVADGSVTAFQELVWTGGTQQLRALGSADLTCLNWTSGDPNRRALAGVASSIDLSAWSAATQSCDTGQFLYCVEPPGSP